MSHPLGVRELKPVLCLPGDLQLLSHPLGVRELKLQQPILLGSGVSKSHPLGVRELKRS